MALLIATYTYQDAELRDLNSPPHDVREFGDVLRDHDIGSFDEVVSLLNQPLQPIRRAVAAFYRRLRRDDLGLLYFSGHGLKDEYGQLHLAAADSVSTEVSVTALAAAELDKHMSASLSRQMVLILDCCYSGAYQGEPFDKAGAPVFMERVGESFKSDGRVVLSASSATEAAFEGERLNGSACSVFTQHLVEGLRDGSADIDQDGRITHEELFRYAFHRVVEQGRQRPDKQEKGAGRIVIAHNINWDIPHELRRQLQNSRFDTRLAALSELEALYEDAAPDGVVRRRIAEEYVSFADKRENKDSVSIRDQAVRWLGAQGLAVPEGPTPVVEAPAPVPKPVPKADLLADAPPPKPEPVSRSSHMTRQDLRAELLSKLRQSHAAPVTAPIPLPQQQSLLSYILSFLPPLTFRGWRKFVRSVTTWVMVLAIVGVVSSPIWLSGWDHRHNLATNQVTGVAPEKQTESCAFCQSSGTWMNYKIRQQAPITSTFVTDERDTRYLHVIVRITNLSKQCDKANTQVTYSFVGKLTTGAATSRSSTGKLDDTTRSRTIEYLPIGKPTRIEFRAAVRDASVNCIVGVQLKEAILHSLPPDLHGFALNYLG